MPKKKKQKSFTLIELLVVIAIIALFASLIVVATASARNRGKDARAMAEMDQMRKGAAIIYAHDASYLNVLCSTTAPVDLKRICDDINSSYTLTLQSTAVAYCGYLTLKSPKANPPTTNYFCIDSTGKSKETTTNPGATLNTYCNGTSYVCP